MKVVISLTTVPERLDQEVEIKQCLTSLCTQNYSKYEVSFNIPFVYRATSQKYNIPSWLVSFQEHYPCLRIYRCDDFGPPTKFLPTIERESKNTLIITVDDDFLYHSDMIKEHIKYQKLFSNSVVVYAGDGLLNPPKFGDIRDAWVICVTEPTEVRGFQHYKSASYKVKLFKDSFFKQYVGKTFSDDILVSTYFLRNNIKMIVAPYEADKELFSTEEGWHQNQGVETFPILKHLAMPNNTGCNHPNLLKLQPKFYDPFQ